MTEFLLIRHGENDVLRIALAGRAPGVPLNAEGREQAQRLSWYLREARIRAIYSSPLERALQTAEPLAEMLGLPVLARERLIEVGFGDWTMKEMKELDADPEWIRWTQQRSRARGAGRESMVEIQARMVLEIEDLAAAHPDQTIALFSHGDPIRAALCHLLGMPLDFVPRMEISPASVTRVKVWPDRVQVQSMNETLNR